MRGIGGGHHQIRRGPDFIMPGQHVAQSGTIAMPLGDHVFTAHLHAQLCHAPPGLTIGCRARNLAPHKGLWGDDQHLFALFCQCPRRAHTAPVATFIIDNHLVAQPRLAPQHRLG